MEFVTTPLAPLPAGHYSQAVIHQGLVYVSGQLPVDPTTGERKTGSLEEQALQILSNLDQILNAAGSDRNHVLKVTVYITDIHLWERFNKVYSEFFGSHRPARSVVPVHEIHFGCLLEIDAIAALK
jgi:2-iminobutanoate/2-iminopropanoate deaminase